ncbi:MAG: hypothetical protein QY327_00100 [Fimbriimonadaceae bacterium]|nr:MAG: hypothetical protein UZ18_ATM001002017 [Armatimonadetes bacterium OLB18]MBV6490775.1 hypothetical protein [Fimbriimonadaceae bacterium]QOJ12222.1 MAG: hypothetical protein HRU74_09245 [Chthonomonadaceae bacterium]MCL4284401.1 hypothetical protein [Fimbriimonadaceae bacterium]MCZ7581150.1 hypothetical protein [Fimbriimonadaceae bacterium]
MALALCKELSAIEALEEALVNCYRTQIGSLPGPEQRRHLSQLRDANEELHKLSGSQPVDYDLPAIGDAYALKFHLMRADNLLISLGACKSAKALPERAQVLDLGSGTGSSAWALAAWTATKGGSYDIASIEESQEMTKTSHMLWRSLQRQNRLSGASISLASAMPTCDILVANHLFSMPLNPSDARRQMKLFGTYAAQIRSGGVGIILTPNVDEKLALTQRAVQSLFNEGFELILEEENAEPPRNVTTSDHRRPVELCQLRRELDQMGESAGVGQVFRDPEFDDPYFGFYGRLTIFRRP